MTAFRLRPLLVMLLLAVVVGAVGGTAWLRGDLTVPGLPSGTRVIAVTNLNADGPGSLTAALMESGSRLIVFEVGGVIDLRSQSADRPFRILTIRNGNVVVAGETAPSPGIHLIGAPLEIRASNVVIRHLNVYTGTGFPYYSSSDAIKIDAAVDQVARNILIENNGFFWAIDETGETWTDPNGFQPGQISDVTFRNNIFGEALHSDLHPKGPHSNGFLISHGAQHITFEKNLFASNFRRNPWICGDTSVLLLNNLIYNPARHAVIFSGGSSYGGVPVVRADITALGNVLRAGPNTQSWLMGSSDGIPKMFYADPAAVASNTHLYLNDNVFKARNGSAIGTDISVFNDDTGTIQIASAPLTWSPVAPESILPASEVESYVLSHVGARPWDSSRPVTSRILAAIQAGTHHLITSESEVGGYPTMQPTARSFDQTTLFAIPEGYLDGAGGGNSPPPPPPPPPPSGNVTVGDWPLDAPHLGTDASNNSNDLDASGSPEIVTDDGVTVGLFRETSEDYLQGEPSETLNVDGGSFTVSAWFKPVDAAQGTGDLHGIVAKSRYGRFGNATFQIYHENDVVRFTIGDRTPGPPPNTDPALTKADIVSSPTQISSGEWSHVVAWYDKDTDTISISVNGEEPVTVPAEFTSGFANTADNGYLLIGTLYNHARFDGSIDTVQMWKKLLSEEERRTLYEGSPHFNGTSLPPQDDPPATPNAGNVTILNNDDTSFFVGPYSRPFRGMGYMGDIHFIASNTRTAGDEGSLSTLWYFEDLQPSTAYDVYFTWPGNPLFTDNLAVNLFTPGSGGSGFLHLDPINESVPPRADTVYDGVSWQKLGRFTTGQDGMIVIQHDPVGNPTEKRYIIMDAAMAVRVE